MEDRTQQVLSCKVSVEDAAAIKERAQALGISVSEFLRTKALADPDNAITHRLERLIKYLAYQNNLIHEALYFIAEEQGKAKRFLSTEELQNILARAAADSILYGAELPDKLAATEAAISAAREQQGE